MGRDFFVQWEGTSSFELVDQDDLERKLAAGYVAIRVYEGGDKVEAMTLDESSKWWNGHKVRLFIFT